MISLDEFGGWALSVGQVANPNGSYPGQCVSLVQQYLNKCYGIPYAPRGNAKDFTPPKFHQIYDGSLHPGDIVRYGANYGYGYGHIGIIDVNGKFLDQNGLKPLKVAYANRPFSGIEAIFRPDNLCKLRPSSGGSQQSGRVTQHGTFKANTNMNIRRAPNLSGQVVATFTTGATQAYDSYIDSDGYRWVSWIGASGNRNYVAVRRLSDNYRFGKCY